MKSDFVVVGCGFAGAVIAERIANVLNKKVLVVDKRSHIGGTSYSHRDAETGIDVHDYGSHIFHTDSREIWNYVNGFSTFNQYQHKAIIDTRGMKTIMPINLKTIEDVFKYPMNPQQAEERIKCDIYHGEIHNLEQKAMSLVGDKLYRYCIEGYTTKQWNRKPSKLPEDIITRLPVRFNYNSSYFNDRYQGIPENGYDGLIENMLKSPNIELRLNTSYEDMCDEIGSDTRIFYSGMIDRYFGFTFGKLEWRSLKFEFETLDVDDYQGNSIVNYGDVEVPYTRIHEFKHYQPERKELFGIGKTIICHEYPQDWKDGMEAYYPIETEVNKELLHIYQEYAKETAPNVTFIGRLGQYRYFDMDDVIADSLIKYKEMFG